MWIAQGYISAFQILSQGWIQVRSLNDVQVGWHLPGRQYKLSSFNWFSAASEPLQRDSVRWVSTRNRQLWYKQDLYLTVYLDPAVFLLWQWSYTVFFRPYHIIDYTDAFSDDIRICWTINSIYSNQCVSLNSLPGFYSEHNDVSCPLTCEQIMSKHTWAVDLTEWDWNGVISPKFVTCAEGHFFGFL